MILQDNDQRSDVEASAIVIGCFFPGRENWREKCDQTVPAKTKCSPKTFLEDHGWSTYVLAIYSTYFMVFIHKSKYHSPTKKAYLENWDWEP